MCSCSDTDFDLLILMVCKLHVHRTPNYEIWPLKFVSMNHGYQNGGSLDHLGAWILT